MSRNVSVSKTRRFIIIKVSYDPYFEIHPVFPGEIYSQDTTFDIKEKSIKIICTDGGVSNIEGEFCEEHADVREARAQTEILRITHRVMES